MFPSGYRRFILSACLALAAFQPVAQSQTSPRQAVYTPDQDALDTLDRAMSHYVEDQTLASLSYGFWQNGQQLQSGFFGPANDQTNATIADNTIHRIYSMTKPVTAVGLLILVERGAVDLEDPITKFLPEFDRNDVLADYDEDGNMYTYAWLRPPTIAQLLSHTAGLGNNNHEGGLIDRKLAAANVTGAANTDALVQQIARLPFKNVPGAYWDYSLASDLQGAIIERVAGETLDVFLERELFAPLQMEDTAFYVPDEKAHRVSSVSKQTIRGWIYYEDESISYDHQSQQYFEGGHGLFSTQLDYARFLEMLRNDGRLGAVQILRPDTVKRFQTNAIVYRGEPGRQGGGDRAGLGYGFGVGTIESNDQTKLAAPNGSYYWSGARGTWFWVDPVNEIVFVGMIQTVSEIVPSPIEQSMRAVYAPEELVDGDAAIFVNAAASGVR
ncbi:MAG: serine hydrolase domain-containing protein [Pseudomonadota bacterium]